MNSYLRRTFHFIKITVIILLCIRTFILEPGMVNGRSMEKTFLDNDFFLLNKIILLIREPKRGDIVVVQEPNVDKIMIKRVIGLPGEQISINQQGVFVRNEQGKKFILHEPYLEKGIRTTTPDGSSGDYTKIPPHSYFLMGDGRTQSSDSRIFGAFHRKTIYGLVMPIHFFNR